MGAKKEHEQLFDPLPIVGEFPHISLHFFPDVTRAQSRELLGGWVSGVLVG